MAYDSLAQERELALALAFPRSISYQSVYLPEATALAEVWKETLSFSENLVSKVRGYGNVLLSQLERDSFKGRRRSRFNPTPTAPTLSSWKDIESI